MRLTYRKTGVHLAGEDDAKFVADCMALITRPAVPPLPGANMTSETAQGEAGPRVAASKPEHDTRDAGTQPDPADQADLHGIIRELKTHIEELRKALTEAQAQNKESSEISRQNEMLRQALAHANDQRSSDAKALRREAQVRAELESLREELDNVKTRHNDTTTALDAAIQRGHEARAEAAAAMTLVLDHDSEVARLRHTITERDREIDDLRRHLLEAEQARAADAAAFLDSLK